MDQINPFVISIWCGESKPSNLNNYLNLFVAELNNVLMNGVCINNHQIKVHDRCFICDKPALAFIKGG